MKKGLAFLLMGVMALAVVGCGKKAGSSQQEKTQAVITLGAYTVPKEAYQKEILPLFAKKWKALSGTEVSFRESYLASGAQSRAILSGFEADVAALSVPEDVARLEKNGPNKLKEAGAVFVEELHGSQPVGTRLAVDLPAVD